ncbi:hypothetical protein D3C83_191830 [compost metagenome]
MRNQPSSTNQRARISQSHRPNAPRSAARTPTSLPSWRALKLGVSDSAGGVSGWQASSLP